MIDKSKLKELARAEGLSGWWWDVESLIERAVGPESAEFIVAANPAAILELLAELESARNAALEEAAEKLESMNDSAGDRASYDNRDMTCCEAERMHALMQAVEAIRSLATTTSTEPPASPAADVIDIPCWQERMGKSGRRECESLAIECMEAEIKDLRNVLERGGTSPAPSAKQEPSELIAAIGKLIATQDNRYTDQPMFIVQQRRRLYGLDSGYCENIIWLCSEDEHSEASEEEAAILEKEYQKTGIVKSGWTRTGYIDQWEFVTACFTEQGCKDYLARDGHNLKEPRIYAEGSYRNEEFRAIRNWLLSLAAPSASASPAAPEMPARPVPTHRCKVCGALWKLWANGEGHPSVKASWSLVSPTCGQCCDNVAMGDQIEPYSVAQHRAAQEATLAKGIENMRRNMHDSGMDLGPSAAPVAGSQQVPDSQVKATHEQALAGYAVACKFGVYEARAFNLADEMFAAFAAAAPAVPVPAEQARDAARYRWIRSRENSLETRQYDKGIHNGPSCYHEVEGIRELKSGEKLDAAVDAAMAAPSLQQGKEGAAS